jgi:uncharacterized phage-like protein YoqJ
MNSTYKSQTVCFTGPRPHKLAGFAKEAYQPVIDTTMQLCKKLYQVGAKQFISGGAQGFDMLAFETVNKLKSVHPDIKNVVYIPFTDYDKYFADYGLFSKNYARNLFAKADEVKYVSQSDNLDIVIALYPDGSWLTAEHSGTANCMRYAKQKGKTIYQIKYACNGKCITDIKIVRIN